MCPTRSILAGCTESVLLVRSFLGEQFGKIAERNDDVHQAVLVDDVAHVVVKPKGHALGAALEVALDVKEAAQALNFKLSCDKSMALVSRRDMAKPHPENAQGRRNAIKFSQLARDTGVWLNVSGKRSRTFPGDRSVRALKKNNSVKT